MKKPLSLFAGFGIELEYMIVNTSSLDVAPISDRLIHKVAGEYANEIERGKIAWSNELALHVIELKTNGPAKDLNDLPELFLGEIRAINTLLQPMQAKLMPSGAHPWMNPDTEAKLWPHEQNPIYESYNRIFDCRGHGWSNLQSAHLNLPFADDLEIARLHSAIRLILPIIPALSASTPIIGSKPTGVIDTRLEFYRKNQQKLSLISGKVIPECVSSKREYETKILQPMYQQIAPFDPEGILQEEWLNSRGAIARFDRNAIEIRIIDTQECPLADIAIIFAIVTILKALVAEQWQTLSEQQHWSEDELARIFVEVVKNGQSTFIDNADYLNAFGYHGHSCSAKELWQHLLAATLPKQHVFADPLTLILSQGNLSERILRAFEREPSAANLKTIYAALTECLQQNKLFSNGPV